LLLGATNLLVGMGLLACAERKAGTKTADDGALYSACSSHSDCRGSGLLCDDRRGCVECLEQSDCASGERCRSGVCESKGSSSANGDGGTSEDDASSAAALTGGKKPSSSGPGSDNEPSNGPGGDPSDPSASPGTTTLDGGTPGGNDGPAPNGGDGPTPNGGDDPAPNGPGPDGSSTPVDVPPPPECALHLPVTYRDFSGAHVDFGEHSCSGVTEGIVAAQLNAEGLPVATGVGLTKACIQSAATFDEWYRDSASVVTVPGELLLYEDGDGGWVNRWGPNGEQFTSIDDTNEGYGGIGLDGCETTCKQTVLNENHNSACSNECAPQTNALRMAQSRKALLEAALEDPSLLELADGGAGPPASEIEAEITELDASILDLQAQADACLAQCEAAVAAETAACAATCKPCSYNPEYFCPGGETIYHDGTPLFFPVDGVTGTTADLAEAKIPEEYGYIGWPWESDWFPDAPEHNFYFTTHLEVEFTYHADVQSRVEFIGDDDLWAFINGQLVIDLGGLHVPSAGAVTLTAAEATTLGLEDGETYALSIFHAERQMEGSSFKLRLHGFDLPGLTCE